MRVTIRAILLIAILNIILIGTCLNHIRHKPAEAYWDIGSTYYGNNEDIYRVIMTNETPEFTFDAYGYPITTQQRKLRLTNNAGMDTEPEWSPNGKWIVYVTQIGNKYYLYRMAAGGANRQNLGEIGSPYAARGWSLDSEWVTVYSGGSLSAEQFAVHLETGRRIWMNVSTAPLWTQNSEWVVFTSMRTLEEGIWRLDPATGNKERLTEGLADFATLSPDGQWIVFSSGFGPGSVKRIFRMRIDGSDLKLLTDGTYPSYNPRISPNSQWILFLALLDDQVELYKMRMDGSEITRLTDNFMAEENIEWSPDGTKIYFWGLSAPNDYMHPYQMDADGRNLKVLDSTPNLNYSEFRSLAIDLDWMFWTPYIFAVIMLAILIAEIVHFMYRSVRGANSKEPVRIFSRSTFVTGTLQTDDLNARKGFLETSDNPINFSAFYPKEVMPEIWMTLTAYIYRLSARVSILQDCHFHLGDQILNYRYQLSSALNHIPKMADVTATPHLEGFIFNPRSITLGFYEDWHRFDFKLKADLKRLHLASNGSITFTVDGGIIAEVPLSIYVGERSSPSFQHVVEAAAHPYRKIFCSYSHDDLSVVEWAETIGRLFGDDFLRDLTTIKSGQIWSDELYKMINEADIFQLFWSKTASKSEWVQKEWRYATTLEHKHPNFIRPVYWEQPLEAIPSELAHLHFVYEPELKKYSRSTALPKKKRFPLIRFRFQSIDKSDKSQFN